jgi:hypothetical protein
LWKKGWSEGILRVLILVYISWTQYKLKNDFIKNKNHGKWKFGFLTSK